MIEPPAALGMEAAGVVVDVGEGVAHLLPGDRVAYACAPPGAYVDVRTLAADQVVVLPDDVDDETAAALMLKGMTARVPPASHASRARRRHRARARGGGRRRPVAVPVGEGARRARDRHGVERRQGAACARARLRAVIVTRDGKFAERCRMRPAAAAPT